jgi:hypothetical protein
MQAAWKEKKDETPSVCDWMLLGEGHCVVIDATNHAVKADAAQGLATFDEYAADIDKFPSRTSSSNSFRRSTSRKSTAAGTERWCRMLRRGDLPARHTRLMS